MPGVSELSFSRCTDPDGDILDDCWVTQLPDVALSFDCLAKLFSDPADSTLDLYLAGKPNGPNRLALETASNALGALEHYLPQIDLLPNPELSFTTIWVPYQTATMLFVKFWSEYGSDLEYGIKLHDCPYGPQGLMYPSNTEDRSVGSVPGAVKYVLQELSGNLDDRDTELAKVVERIQADEIMGVEILSVLMNIVRRNFDSLEMAEHYLALLGHISHHASVA